MFYLYSLLLLIVAETAVSQTLTWKALSLPKASDRYNDIWFVDPLVGWAIIPSNGTVEDGHIYKTTDGGSSWITQYSTTKHLRSICFLDSLVGFVGRLSGGGHTPLMSTVDGGVNWDTVAFDGPMPSGICGMMKVDDSTVVGTGQVGGPAHLIRTTDRGLTWTSTAITSSEQDWAIDCSFWSRDSGVVAGSSRATSGPMVSHIWRTTDGGASWTDAYIGEPDSPVHGDWCWKISFPGSEIGYIALEHDKGPSRVLKTIDRGETWQRILIPSATSKLQGAGFINDRHGWVGGRSFGAYVTEDGGQTWNSTKDIQFVNRFRFFGDSVGYAAGDRIYKLTKTTSTVTTTVAAPAPIRYDAWDASLRVLHTSNSTLSITDVLGRTVLRASLVDETHRVDVSMLPAGIYIARLHSGESLKFSR